MLDNLVLYYIKFCAKSDLIILSINTFEFCSNISADIERALHQALFLRASLVYLGALKHCPAVIVER